MEILLENLNPYEFKQIEKRDFRFSNSNGIKYQVYFSDGSGYFDELYFSKYINIFGFRPLSKTDFRYDSRTVETIICILVSYLRQDNYLVMFVCDESDEKQSNRNRLFNIWFKKYNDGSFEKLDLVFEQHTYVSAILARNNPFYLDFKHSFPTLGEEYK